MAQEIERKFLLANDDWRQQVRYSRRIHQGYLVDVMNENATASVRIRIDNERANINIKSAAIDIVRQEYEYVIPLHDAEQMLAQLCHQPCIDKQRHIVEYDGWRWEIDEFFGDNAGLLIAELELESVQQQFTRPPWLGREVSDDPRYYNVNLITQPYCKWCHDAAP